MSGRVGLVLSLAVIFVAILFVADVPQPLKPFQKGVKDILFQFLGTPLAERQSQGDKRLTPTGTGKVLSKAELAKYDGSKGSPGLYLAILGQIFDVSKGARHYGPGGGYDFFAGKDGTRAYVSGDFTAKGLIEDVKGLRESDLLGLEDWLKFYSKDYKYVGKVDGYFYDSKGQPTQAFLDLEKALEAAHVDKLDEEGDQKRFPPCNSEWSQAAGGRVWCSNMSGGIERDWVGVPRRYFKATTGVTRCACVRTTGPPSDDPKATTNRGDLDNPAFRIYRGCGSTSESCPLLD